MRTDRSSKILADCIMSDDKIEDAAKLLRLYAAQGYKRITACPLYHGEQTVSEFIGIREKNLRALKKAVSGEKLPEITGGAEVLLDPAVLKSNLKALACNGKIAVKIKAPEKGKSLFPFLNRLIYGAELKPVISRYDITMLDLSEQDRRSLYTVPQISYIFSAPSLADLSVRREMETIKKHKRSLHIGTYARDVLGNPPQTELADWAVALIWGSEDNYTEYMNMCCK